MEGSGITVIILIDDNSITSVGRDLRKEAFKSKLLLIGGSATVSDHVAQGLIQPGLETLQHWSCAEQLLHCLIVLMGKKFLRSSVNCSCFNFAC